MHLKFFPPLLALLLAGLLAGCAESSGTIAGLAGHQAPPPAPVLFITPTSHGSVATSANTVYANDLVDALAGYGVPATVEPPQDRNWQLQVAVTQADQSVVPSYRIIGPNHKVYGQLSGAPVTAQGWETGDQAVLSQVAGRDAAILSGMLAKINAKVQLENPESLANRTPRLFIGTVSGAPGDGDLLLPIDLGRDLSAAGLKLVTDQKNADFSVTAIVKITPVAASDAIAELDWHVHDSNGRLVGQVTQLRELKAPDLSTAWQTVAASLAQEAATGVATVVHNDIVKGHAPASH